MEINVCFSMLTICVLSSTKSVDDHVSDKDTLLVDAFHIRCIRTSQTQPTADKVHDMRDSAIEQFSRDKVLEHVSKHLNSRFLDDNRT